MSNTPTFEEWCEEMGLKLTPRQSAMAKHFRNMDKVIIWKGRQGIEPLSAAILLYGVQPIKPKARAVVDHTFIHENEVEMEES